MNAETYLASYTEKQKATLTRLGFTWNTKEAWDRDSKHTFLSIYNNVDHRDDGSWTLYYNHGYKEELGKDDEGWEHFSNFDDLVAEFSS
jgi:hypothetical protein